MLRRTEQVLNGANIAAQFSTVAEAAANLTLTGGATAAIGAALSGVSIFKGMGAEDQRRTEEIAATMDAWLSGLPRGDTPKLVRQLIAKFPVSEADLVTGNRDAGQVAKLLRDRAEEEAIDSEQRDEHVLKMFEAVLRAALAEPLRALTARDAYEKEDLKRTDYIQQQNEQLLHNQQQMMQMMELKGQAERMRTSGIDERAILDLAKRVSEETSDLDQALAAVA